MAAANFSLEFLTNNLMEKIDRKMIFPPHLNDPVELLAFNRANRPSRPPNGFLLCRKNVNSIAKEVGIANMRVISKVAGIFWRSATLEEKEMYENLANEVSTVYTQRYNVEKSIQSNQPTLMRRISPVYIPYYIPESPRFNSYFNDINAPMITQMEHPLNTNFLSEQFPNGFELYNETNTLVTEFPLFNGSPEYFSTIFEQ
ncbi:7087_t:CDS:1 [Funneliformis geosporum]|uniref:13300_t:CDS:1 n=1 Tax=Funneliformis geosporum TaxID=1117311 RepID=A0A9W4SD18_9GLOM|nr:7087_t:CDS:1 [Funneliformis geosporum]CAI2162778.1 13300_t:CDS:1 [Funneliformis geosporum]